VVAICCGAYAYALKAYLALVAIPSEDSQSTCFVVGGAGAAWICIAIGLLQAVFFASFGSGGNQCAAIGVSGAVVRRPGTHADPALMIRKFHVSLGRS
jgi:hypothetical protein